MYIVWSQHVSRAANGAELAEKLHERSGEQQSEKSRGVYREVTERERSGEWAEYAGHGHSRLSALLPV